MEKLWAECSQAEKDEVRQIEKEQKGLKKQFLMGTISHRKYSYRLTKLIHRLDEIEKKYATETV